MIDTVQHGAAQQATQHPFLFQPAQQDQKKHYSSSGDDGDSPPSLTNSSESPQSASEEGGTLSPHVDSYRRSALHPGQPKPSYPQPHGLEGGNCRNVALRAASPTWDSVFGTTAGPSDVMDFSQEQRTAGPHLSSTFSLPKTESPNGSSDNDTIPPPSDPTKWQTAEEARTSDDAMFETLIQQENFDQNSSADFDDAKPTSDEAFSVKMTLDLPARSTSRSDLIADDFRPPSDFTPPQSAHPSTSALSSRRNSMDADALAAHTRMQQRIPHSGSHYSHTSDADLPTSSSIVVRPSVEDLTGLQVHVHGISFSGAKSRVETQIRLRLELVRPVPSPHGDVTSPPSAFERIGAFTHVKLPPLTGTKRRSKKHKQVDVDAERTLFMDAAVVRATPPHERVSVCRSCQQREKKRAQRRKSGGKKDEPRENDEEQLFTSDDYQELGIDPNAPDARKLAKQRTDEEDEKRVVVFNCGDFVGFEDGACILPTRITCYCRHHREKTGFCLIFTMRDFRGNLVATGSTPPIMITDDHKSVAAVAAAAAAAASSGSGGLTGSIRRVEGTRSRAVSSEAADKPVLQRSSSSSGDMPAGVKAEGGRKARRAQRSKPYGDAEERGTRRNTSLSMTPHASTGQNTPAVHQSPPALQSDINHPDFWNAFAAINNMSGSPSASSRASTGVQTPHTEVTSPSTSTQPLLAMHTLPVDAPQSSAAHHISTHQPTNMQDWIASVAGQGSISAQTLNVGPQSLPGFDLNSFVQSIQRGQREGDQASVQHLLMLARSLPGISLENNAPIGGSLMAASSSAQQLNSAPVASISKLIPGEGPTNGGIEVTVLGENFVDGMTCYFGDVAATSTRVWGSNTLLCILPPSVSPGPVAVTVKRYGQHDSSMVERFNNTLQLFTYVDATDRALMELALQVVGLQMTGQMQSARDVAMRVVGSGPNQGMTRAHGTSGSGSSSGQQQQLHPTSLDSSPSRGRSAFAGLFAQGANNLSFQDSVVAFLRMMDIDLSGVKPTRWNFRAIRLANKQGHTLLHLAVMLGFQRLTLDLIQRGAPINARDHNGYTALHFTALYGRVSLARVLLAQGAQADILSDVGQDALDVAREQEQIDVEEILEQYSGEGAGDVDACSDVGLEDGVSGQIDDDNISSNVDESGEESYSSSEKDDEEDEDERDLLNGQHPILSARISVTEEESLRSLAEERQQEHARKAEKDGLATPTSTDERKVGLKGFVFGGLASRARFGMPNALHGGLPHFNVPVVSVFQMALPPSLTNWTAVTHPGGETSSKDKDRRGRGPSSPGPSMWRDILEESALWINPLSAPPPPAYDTLEAPANGASIFPAIASTSSSEVSTTNADRQNNGVGGDTGEDIRPETVASSTSTIPAMESFVHHDTTPAEQALRSMTGHIIATNDGINAGLCSELVRSSKTVRPRRATSSIKQSSNGGKLRSLQDDRMLVYFWMPILVSVVLLLCFASPSSVLSFGDLMSYMPF